MKYLSLVICTLCLVACANLQGSPLSAEPQEISWQAEIPPIAVAKVSDVQGNLSLYSGQEFQQGVAYPDGRVWLHDAHRDLHYLLTREEDFGQHFYASGGLFLTADQVLVKVNSSSVQEALYLINLSDQTVRHWLNSEDLGFMEIHEENWILTPDKHYLGFTASKEIVLSDDAFVWQQGVYSLELATLNLKTITLQPYDQAPQTLVPALLDGAITAQSL